MNERETRSVLCPFCGAPQRELVPSDTVETKCPYCGGMFLVKPELGKGVLQCPNHPDKMSVGLCNDCGESYCGDCLHVYSLSARNEVVALYLCPDCLRERYSSRANSTIVGGILLLLLGGFGALYSPSLGLLVVPAVIAITGLAVLIDGASKKRVIPRELTVNSIRGTKEEASQISDARVIYDELLRRYALRWGYRLGLELLNSEIKAYTLRGESYADAVKMVRRRQEKER